MFFRRKKPPITETETKTETSSVPAAERKPQACSSSAETAHLIGPGCLKLQGGLLRWQPVEGRHVILHPHQIGRILMYGATDVTGSALRRIWQSGIQVVFLSPQGHQLLGKVLNDAYQIAPRNQRRMRHQQDRCTTKFLKFKADFSK